MVGAGILMMVMGNVGGIGGEALGPVAGVGLGAFYLLLAASYLFPALYLIRYRGPSRKSVRRIRPPWKTPWSCRQTSGGSLGF
jgi:hypothetical protein